MTYLNVGFNFEEETFNLIKELNESGSENRIASVYGSDIEHVELSARPDYRFPENATLDMLLHYADRFSKIGVKFWYTGNSIDIGGKNIDHEKIHKLLQKLYDNDIGMIVSDTMLLEIIKRSGIPVKVELSTIMRIESPRELFAIKEQYPFVIKMVMHISYNRSFYLLNQFVKVGRICNIVVEVLCNELCGTGYKTGASPCIHRDKCYSLHAQTKTLKEASKLSNYPFNKCVGNRYTDTSNFLKLFWILPQDFHYYTDIGINSFKLTGRTATTEFMKHALTQYVEGTYRGDIAKLWKSIESINSNKGDLSNIKTVNAEGLEDFMKPFASHEIECHSRLCGIDCNHCIDTWENIK